ncbi:EF-hand domain-containing family member B, partial [Takifugu flavidus]
KGQGFIDKEDLQAVCHQFQLHVSGPVLDDLMDYCDTDGDGLINFVEFANFLSWKDMMPINSQEERALTRGPFWSPEDPPGPLRTLLVRVTGGPQIELGWLLSCEMTIVVFRGVSLILLVCLSKRMFKNFKRPSSTASADREEPQPPPGQALVKPEDLEPVNPAGSLKSVRTLVKQQADPDQFRTMSSVIGLRGESRASDSCTYGIPTVRTDLPVPRVKRVGDSTNYGDAATASELLRPSVYDLYGVDEEQLLCPRSRKELSQIFVGLDLSEETFEEVWKLASAEHEAGEVCVDSFCRLLKEIKAM